MRRLKLSILVMSAVAACVISASAVHAQSLGLWGGWTDGGHEWQGTEPKRNSREGGNPGANSGGSFGFGSGPNSGYGYGGAFPTIMDVGPRPIIRPEAPPMVALPNEEVPGTILIDNEARRLYFTLNAEQAYVYPISVGRDGFTWTGTETISRIADWPDWHPPEEMRQRDPRLPEKMFGGIKNPLGAKALFLGNTLYRIHGTNDPKTIGYAASSGCFRMMNAHVLHLATLVDVGTTVKVVDSLAAGDAVAELPWLQKPAALGVSVRRSQ